jgi:hypothetical protein
VFDAELVDPADTGRPVPGTALERWRLETLRPPTAGDRREISGQAARDAAWRIALATWALSATLTLTLTLTLTWGGRRKDGPRAGGRCWPGHGQPLTPLILRPVSTCGASSS